jgi:PIN domain nuclease of toxin-antitoxin system
VSDSVLDASAVLAFVNREPGAAIVEDAMSVSAISTVNLAEVVTRLVHWGIPIDDTRRLIADMRMEVANFDEDFAYHTGLLRTATRHRGLSLGDRACLALAQRLGVPALTADRQWSDLDIGVEVRLIRD